MAKDDAVRTMIDWVINVRPADLAAELMGVFGGGDSLEGYDILNWLFELHGYPKVRGSGSQVFLSQPGCELLEAIQLLEHAELVYESRWTMRVLRGDTPYWKATRFGLATLTAGKAAVRQRIKDRTGL